MVPRPVPAPALGSVGWEDRAAFDTRASIADRVTDDDRTKCPDNPRVRENRR